MNLIGFDTSLPVVSACVVRADGRAFATPAPASARLLGPATHSADLLPALRELVDESGMGWQQIDAIAVGIGPGTFTGLRIGVATARALGQALGAELRPVPSLAALAATAAGEGASAPGQPLLALIDARRGEVFAALYRRSGRVADAEKAGAPPLRSPESPQVELEWGPAVLEPGALLAEVERLGETPLCVGDWAIESRAELESAGAEVPASESGLHSVNALYVCKLAATVVPVPPDQVRPLYLRLPDAEINRRLAEEHRR